MKMKDVFNLPLYLCRTAHGCKVICDDLNEAVSEGDYDDFEIAAAHAINSHDNLVSSLKLLVNAYGYRGNGGVLNPAIMQSAEIREAMKLLESMGEM